MTNEEKRFAATNICAAIERLANYIANGFMECTLELDEPLVWWSQNYDAVQDFIKQFAGLEDDEAE